jgi:hypothetical protein
VFREIKRLSFRISSVFNINHLQQSELHSTHLYVNFLLMGDIYVLIILNLNSDYFLM